MLVGRVHLVRRVHLCWLEGYIYVSWKGTFMLVRRVHLVRREHLYLLEGYI